jgi:hypothetical protein
VIQASAPKRGNQRHPKLVKENCDTCPTCGGVVKLHRVLVDLNHNLISYQGLQWSVPPRLAEFVFCLMGAYPDALPDREMKLKIWGRDNLKHVSDLTLLAHSARMMFRPFGSDVQRDRLAGYRLVLVAHHLKR